MNQVDREILAELWHFEFHKNVRKMPYFGIQTKVEHFQNAPNPNFDLYVISFICTNLKPLLHLAQFYMYLPYQ